MRVAIITLHTPLNFGSVLQAYALSRTVADLGHEVCLVDYWRPQTRPFRLVAARFRDHQDLHLPARVYSVADRTAEAAKARRVFNAFTTRHLPLSAKRYGSAAELRLDPPAADVYLVGSDQVWNDSYNGGVDEAFFLNFAPRDARRVAYAGSFGDSLRSSTYLTNVEQHLRPFDALSARERSAVAVLRRLGRPDATHVVDPTLLVDSAFWQAVEQRTVVKRPYVLVYSVEEALTERVFREARVIADRHGWGICQVTFGGRRRRLSGCDHVVNYASPEQFLTLIRRAHHVVTASYHGTALSIMMKRAFTAFAPPRFADRVVDLLDWLDLSHRLAGGELPPGAIEASGPIDFEAAFARLLPGRERSLAFLAQSLRT